MKYIDNVHKLLKAQYGVEPGDVETEAIMQSEREGWTEQQFVSWYATKYELTPIEGSRT